MLQSLEEKSIEIPQKRRRSASGHSSTAASNLVPLKLRKPHEHLFGQLHVKEFVQKLSSLGIQDARVEEVGNGCLIIAMVRG